MSKNKSILVLGAGELGLALLRSLSAKASSHPSTEITVMFRPSTISSSDPEKKSMIAELRSLDIAILPGDIAQASLAELSSLFKPFHTVISCTGFSAGASTQLKLAHAVLAAGVPRYFPWQFGVDYDIIGRGSVQDLFDEQLDVRDLLRGQSKTEWVIVSTGMFTSFLFEPWFGVVDLKSGGVNALGGRGNRVTLTTPEDIGRLTAEVVFAEEPRVGNEVVHVAGDTVTYWEVAAVLERVLGRKMKVAEWEVEALKEELKGDPGNPIRKYRVVFAEGRGVAWDVGKTYNARKHIEVVSLEQWVRENLV